MSRATVKPTLEADTEQKEPPMTTATAPPNSDHGTDTTALPVPDQTIDTTAPPNSDHGTDTTALPVPDQTIDTTTSPASYQATDLLEQLRGGLQGFSGRWLPRAGELSDYLERWETAWNTHDVDQLQALVTEDIVCEDPAMFGETAHGRSEFVAFVELFFRAFPDVHLEGTGALYAALEGTGLALPWRMTGTFTGELAFWGKRYGSRPPTWAPTGRPIDIDGIDLYEFRDGLISRQKLIYDLYDFSQQIGLLPPRDRKVPAVMLLGQRLVAYRSRRRIRA
jgi:steroid delta-isomerase-like uncharacterized protein